MNRSDSFRDYLYVSARKVVRMSRTLRRPVWKGLQELQVKLGPVGAAVKISEDSRPEDVIGLVPKVEHAIDKKFGINYLTDPQLQAGQWFLIDAAPMSYGIPETDGISVLFAGEEAGRRFILGGSAEYLLDRPMPVPRDSRWGFSASGLGGLRDLLWEMASDENGRWSRDAERFASDHHRNFEQVASRYDHFFDTIRQAFGTSQEPLTALVRCLDIDVEKDVVLGTPLYVAFDVP